MATTNPNFMVDGYIVYFEDGSHCDAAPMHCQFHRYSCRTQMQIICVAEQHTGKPVQKLGYIGVNKDRKETFYTRQSIVERCLQVGMKGNEYDVPS